MERNCERCGIVFSGKFKYCVKCRKAVRAELQSEGYLQNTGDAHCGMRRTGEQKENQRETRLGLDR